MLATFRNVPRKSLLVIKSRAFSWVEVREIRHPSPASKQTEISSSLWSVCSTVPWAFLKAAHLHNNAALNPNNFKRSLCAITYNAQQGQTSGEIKIRKGNFKHKFKVYRKTEAFRVAMTFVLLHIEKLVFFIFAIVIYHCLSLQTTVKNFPTVKCCNARTRIKVILIFFNPEWIK